MILDLSIDEINTILKGLGNLPYVESVKLIQKIVKEYNEQMTDSH